jgi:alkyl sulfatase BDS1-like metallo-beta-lactamase superfamily hydrolase
MYMYGNLLPRDEKGQVDAGLGKTTSRGSVALIEPTLSIGETPTRHTIDGIEMVFQFTPDTEAPAEMNFHFPAWRVLCMAENCSHNQHNLYTLRGAKVRDAKAWAHYLDEALDLFGAQSDLVFTSHHWPVWGAEAVRRYLSKQRDMYRYLHDQTLRLANHGLTPAEIAEDFQLPPSLALEWYNRSYYGSVSHNSKAVYQRYLGFFDGNPAHLHPLPPEDAGARYVELAGGAEALLDKARDAFERGEYRWVAQLVDHLVFSDPANATARELEADALEQLGYQTENATWRNFFLTGAQELRSWRPADATTAGRTVGGGMLGAAGLEYVFDYLAVRLNGPAAEGRSCVVNLRITDSGEEAVLRVENCVLHGLVGHQEAEAAVTLSLDRSVLNALATGAADLGEEIESGQVSVDGEAEEAVALFGMLDRFDRWFAVVTP